LSAPTTLAVVSLIGFSFIAGLGVGQSHWWLVVGLLLHGLLDLAYHAFLQYPGVPHWYPLPCMAYDWSMAAAVAWRIWSDDRNIIAA
jgi:hypothetical protein